jgi:hypothetical protein
LVRVVWSRDSACCRYTAKNFCDRNKDTMSMDVVAHLQVTLAATATAAAAADDVCGA